MAKGTSLQIAGALFKAFSSISSGREADEVSEQNALQLNAQADVKLNDARQRAFSILRQGRRLRGTQSASTAARGVVVDSGSSIDILTETAINTRLQAADAIRAGSIQRTSLRHASRGQIRRGNALSRAGFIQAGGNLLQTQLNIGLQKDKKKLKRLGQTDLANPTTNLV